MFKKILVANRSEIALRAVRECREMGIGSVAVYSDADAEALFVKHADEAYSLGDPEPNASYLNMEKLLDIARKSGAEAIYPGYGFLAENPKFVEECEAGGIEFIGPPSKSMNAAKPKHKSRDLMKSNGIPVTPGSDGAIEDESGMAKAFEIAEGIGYPVIVKPSGAGGGIGMKVANSKDELAAAMEYAKSLGSEAFGVPAFYLEKYVARAKHIEFQILADKKGNVVYVSDRECSVQRRYQKLIEEAPSPAVNEELRTRLGELAIRGTGAVGYAGAGTVEFLLTDSGDVYFIEMNARIQVEHPVTECVTGLDLVKMQIRAAAGEPLEVSQDDIDIRGHAIECRINAEDPSRNFAPSTGKISTFHVAGGPGVRVDTHAYPEYIVYPYYDALLAKLITFGRDRGEAIQRMRRCLDECVVEGISTTLPFHQRVLADERFVRGDVHTGFIDSMEMETAVS